MSLCCEVIPSFVIFAVFCLNEQNKAYSKLTSVDCSFTVDATRTVTHECCFSLSDTENMYTKVLKIIAGRYDKTFTWDLKVKMMGKSHQESSKVFIGMVC